MHRSSHNRSLYIPDHLILNHRCDLLDSNVSASCGKVDPLIARNVQQLLQALVWRMGCVSAANAHGSQRFRVFSFPALFHGTDPLKDYFLRHSPAALAVVVRKRLRQRLADAFGTTGLNGRLIKQSGPPVGLWGR